MLRGGASNDVFRFKAADLAGDTINGCSGADTITAGAGGASMTGALAADALTGGGGADRFGWNDKLTFSAAAFAVDGAFDNTAFYAAGFTGDITGIDYLELAQQFNSADEIRNYLDIQQTTANHGMFVTARNAQGRFVLYYTANPTAGGFDNGVFEIAEFATGIGGVHNDFQFI